MALGLCLALLLLAPDESRVALEGQVGAGGGFDGNVALAPSGEPTSGSALAAAWAGLGVGWDPGETTHLSAGLRYDGAYYPDATDLSRNVAGADLLWIQGIGEVVAVIAAAGGAWSWYSDPARSGPGIALRATLRVKPWDWLAVRAGYAYSQRWADVDAYSTSSSRIFGSVEGRIATGIYLGLGYAWQTGEQTFYASVPVTTPVAALRTETRPATGSGPGSGSGKRTRHGLGRQRRHAPGIRRLREPGSVPGEHDRKHRHADVRGGHLGGSLPLCELLLHLGLELGGKLHGPVRARWRRVSLLIGRPGAPPVPGLPSSFTRQSFGIRRASLPCPLDSRDGRQVPEGEVEAAWPTPRTRAVSTMAGSPEPAMRRSAMVAPALVTSSAPGAGRAVRSRRRSPPAVEASRPGATGCGSCEARDLRAPAESAA